MLRILLLLCSSSFLLAQTPVVCGDSFFDGGGPNGDYASGEFEEFELCPTNPGDVVFLTFSQVDINDCCDFLEIYQGTQFNGFLGPAATGVTYVSTAPNGCLTVSWGASFSGTPPPRAGFSGQVTCGPPPTCAQPTDLDASTRTTTSVTVDWTQPANAVQSDLYLVATGSAAPTATTPPTMAGVSPPATISGLQVGTRYDVYVRADCGGGDLSFWSAPLYTFTSAAPPMNDECSSSSSLSVSSTSPCSPTIFFDGGATPSNPAAACTDPTDADSWLSFVAPNTSVIVEVNDANPNSFSEGNSRDFEVFGGACGTLTSLGCEGRVTNLTVGATYFIRVSPSFDTEPGSPDARYSACVIAGAAAPPNDGCAAAIDLTPAPGVSCTSVVSTTTAGANESFAANCGGVADDDVWFSFTATSATQLLSLTNVIQTGETFSSTVYYELFSGNCGSLSQLACATISSSNFVALPGLTVGDNYFIRVYSRSGSTTVDFDICLASPPANDDCSGAFEIPVNPTAVCNQVVSGTTVGATVSGPSCPGGTNNGDVFFYFVATGETHILTVPMLTSTNTNFANLFAEISVGDCPTATVLDCTFLTSAPRYILENLIVGERYNVRIFTRSSFTTANFELCIGTPPANDDCTGAFTAAVNPDLTNTLTTAGSSFGGTPSFSINSGDSGCSRTSNDDDVWYRFTALSDEHHVSIFNTRAIPADERFADTLAIVRLYPAGSGCAADQEIDCGFLEDDVNDEEVFTGLTPGEDYFLSVQTRGTRNALSFELSIRTRPVTLPVELTDFRAVAVEKRNRISWVSASEEAFSHYALERSANGFDGWQTVVEVAGGAAGAVGGSYEQWDEAPLPAAYYRLRMVNLDGSEEFSPVRHVLRTEAVRPAVFPNPSDGRLTVVCSRSQILSFYRADGRLAHRERVGPGSHDLQPGLAPGIYLLRFNGEREMRRIVIR